MSDERTTRIETPTDRFKIAWCSPLGVIGWQCDVCGDDWDLHEWMKFDGGDRDDFFSHQAIDCDRK